MTSVQDYLCIFCKESFEDKETLQIHFRKHGDPKFDQTTRAKIRTQNDSPTSLEALKDDNETVSCDVCNEVFPTISKAITHKHKVHPDHDAKYFCPWCGKLFTLKHLYNKHLQSTHDSAESSATDYFHCDCCNVDFFIPSAMIYHNKFFHRQDTDIPAIGQSRKVKLVSQELIQIYYCPFCGEEYNNKINLHKHVTDDHSDEDQSPENILRCPLCEAIFYHLDAYELHLTFHSSEDLYSEENEMLKQIVEFSLDTVPPLMEKLEIPTYDEENEDLNAMGIDQFLQLTMSKDPDDEQLETVEKTKTKKHKKHKKSKKTITLDEFLNMNSDVFGEGLNVHGIEEVPTQIVTKQLKTKKGHTVRNNQKLMSPSDINKLKKQGITIKMKSGKGPTPTKFNQQPSTSTFNKAIPMTSNKISTSSEVLSKLMNQSNSQVKVIKRGSPSNTNVELNSNETNKIIMESNTTQENISAVEENVTKVSVENKELDKDIKISKVDIDSKGQMIALTDTLSNKMEEVSHKSPDSTYLSHNSDMNNPAIVNENTCTQNDTIKDNNFNAIDDKIQDIHNTNEFRDMEDIRDVNKVAAEQILNDFEEGLASTTILRTNIPGNSEDIQSNEVNQINLQNDEDTGESSHDDRDTNNTLNAIKHLGELITVKSVNHSTVSKDDKDTLNVSSHNNQDEDLPIEDDDEIFDNDLNKEDMSAQDVGKSEDKKESTNKTLNALKNLSKHVTIKSLTSQISLSPNKEVTKKSGEESDGGETINDRDDAELTIKGLEKNIVGRRVVNLRHPTKPTIVANNSSQKAHVATKMSIAKKSFQDDELPETLESVKNTSNADLLKRLTNVTAKPIPSKKPLKQEPSFETSKQSLNARNMLKKEKINEEIEIFNIDDSDSDSDKQDSVRNVTPKSSANPNNKATTSSIAKANEALRTLGKNITVKPKEQSTNKIHQNSFIDEESFPDYNESFSDDDDDDDDFDSVCKKFDSDVNRFVKQKNKILESTLKNLGKHITVKPKRMSPNVLQRKHLERNTEKNERLFENDTESDSDSKTHKVKITEVTDNPTSDHEFMSEDDEKHTKNYVIQSPDAGHNDFSDDFSEDEHFDKISDNESSTNQISSTQKPAEKLNQSSQLNENQKCQLSKFKKFNKEITIKSLKEKQTNKDTDADSRNSIENSNDNSNDSKESVVKPFRQNILKYKTKPENSTTQSVHQATLSTNEKATTSNQVSTVNKEVAVKTFQTQTVIEEITTTVTKTIRTVKQEVKSAKTTTIPTLKTQKILNYNNRLAKNAQNMTVRHPTPSVGTKVKNATQPNKPTTSGSRPSNQLVPVRHGLNSAKPCNPTTPPSVRSVTPKLNQQKQVTSRPLKIAPQALGQTIKRSAQESTSQFSCFKKPKDTFPSDTQTRCELDGDASMHLSTSQCRSDFTSTVKNVKGRSVVTATQVKSEMSTSSHLSKLGNVSGLKIVKTSSKQATQVEERIEDHGAKRTMEALQKLQMQGLLVKRPRTDGDNPQHDENDFSNSESENEEDTSEK